MLHLINLNNLRNAEYLQFGEDAYKLISDADAQALGIEKPANSFKLSITDIENAFKLEQSNPLTAQLVDLDDKRDNIFLGIWKITEGYLLHFNPTIATQANLLMTNLLNYGKDTIKISYPAETANINSLITDWETKPDLTATLTTLHLSDWKDELKNVNTDFAKVYSDRAKTDGEAASISAVKQLRLPSAKLWDKLATTIKSQYYLHEDDAALSPKYLTLINGLNALIDTYSNIIAIRKGKSKTAATAKKDGTTTPPPTGN